MKVVSGTDTTGSLVAAAVAGQVMFVVERPAVVAVADAGPVADAAELVAEPAVVAAVVVAVAAAVEFAKLRGRVKFQSQTPESFFDE